MIPHRQPHESPTFYPITFFWLAAAAALILTVEGFFTLALAIVFLAVVAVWLIQFAAWREVRSVHVLVNGQRSEMKQKIAELENLLREKNIPVPASPAEKRDQTKEA